MGCGSRAAYRRVYVSDELDRLYGEYVWQLCEAGADLATDDFDAHLRVRQPRPGAAVRAVATGVGL